MTVPAGADGREHHSCVSHPFDTADRVCHDCGHWYCDGCLVSPWGPRKPVLCVSCAIGRSGVRTSAGKAPSRTAREIRQIEKAERRGTNEPPRPPVVIPTMTTSRQVPLPADDGDGSAPRRSRLRRRRDR